MIDAKNVWRVQIGSRVRRTDDGEILIALSSHQEPDGRVRLRCLKHGASRYLTIQGVQLELMV
ncbi:hypothetical protein MMR14E_10745 [Methylobacterium mesophilicum]